MALQPTTVTLNEFASWFNDTRYAIRAMQDDMLADPIFSILGEDTSNNRSYVLSTTGYDYSGFAKAKTPGGPISRDAPVEADQHSVYYVTFIKRFNYEREAILHDQYNIIDPGGTSALQQLWDGVGLFLTNCFWNYNTSTSFSVPEQNGTITYANATPDAAAIVASTHSGPGYSSKTNIGGTGAFSGSTVVSNIDVGNQNCVTPAGIARAYQPDALVCAMGNAALREAMLQYTRSDKVFSSGNNAVMVAPGAGMDVILLKHAPRTNVGAFDTTAAKLHKWATINKADFKKSMKYKWIERPTIVDGPTLDTDNLDTFRTATCRIAFMAENPWCMIQNNATSAPISAY